MTWAEVILTIFATLVALLIIALILGVHWTKKFFNWLFRPFLTPSKK